MEIARNLLRRAKRERLKDYRKKPPALLGLAACAAILFAAMYLYKAFLNIPPAVETKDAETLFLTIGIMLFFFVMFVKFVISLFSMFSGNRRAWASTIRMCVTYLVSVFLVIIGMPLFFSDMTLWGITIPPLFMVAYMVCLIAFMFLPHVRLFFTPAYAEPAKMQSWALFLVGADPFAARKLRV